MSRHLKIPVIECQLIAGSFYEMATLSAQAFCPSLGVDTTEKCGGIVNGTRNDKLFDFLECDVTKSNKYLSCGSSDTKSFDVVTSFRSLCS